MAPLIIVIEGNVGVGKSAVLNEIKNRGFKVITEPIGLWEPLIKLLGTERKRWTLTFQMYALVHYTKLYKELCNDDSDILFIERCISSTFVFSNVGVHTGDMTALEYNVWKALYDMLKWEPYHTFMLKGPISVYKNRIITRNRSGEEDFSISRISLIETFYELLYSENTSHDIISCEQSVSDITDIIIHKVCDKLANLKV